MQNNLTKAVTKSLDNWVRLSDTNTQILGQLTGGVDDSVFDPDDFLTETFRDSNHPDSYRESRSSLI
jgi:hypothetical protein